MILLGIHLITTFEAKPSGEVIVLQKYLLIVGGVVIILLLAGVGFFIGKTIQFGSEIDSLRAEIGSGNWGIDSQSEGGSSPSIAAVRINQILARYQEEVPGVSERLQEEYAQLQSQINSIQQARERGELTEAEANQQLGQLQQAWNSIGEELIARPLQDAVQAVGFEEGYDIILRIEDVVLFSQNDAIVDITEQVWEEMRD